ADAFSISPENVFGERAVPLGFDEDPSILYFAANIGRDTFGIYDLDLETGQRGGLVIENPHLDLIDITASGVPQAGALVFDRFTRKLVGVRYHGNRRMTAWLRSDLLAVQDALASAFENQSVEIL